MDPGPLTTSYLAEDAAAEDAPTEDSATQDAPTEDPASATPLDTTATPLNTGLRHFWILQDQVPAAWF